MSTTEGKFDIKWIDGKFFSPPGKVCFCNLINPVGFQGSNPKYVLSLQWDNDDPAFQKFKADIDAEDKKYVEGTLKKKWKGNAMWKPGTSYNAEAKTIDEDDTKTKLSIRMNPRTDKSGTMRLPDGFMGVFDKKKTPTEDPRSGDTISVSFSLGGIDTSLRRGVKVYPKLIVVHDRRAGGGGTAADWFPEDAKTPAMAGKGGDDLPAVDVDDLLSD